MALHPQFHMPGGFQSDSAHPDIFRTPAKSPYSASSSGYFGRGAVPGNDDETSVKRKRHGGDGYSTRHRAQNQAAAQSNGTRSNNPFFANAIPEARTYNLAGHLHTPTNEYMEGVTPMAESVYSDSDYRRMLGTKRPRDDVDSSNGPLFPVQPIQQQQYPDQQQQFTQAQGWGAFAFATLGGVVGRLWQFCRAGSFKGFQAGGGRAYGVDGQADLTLPETPAEPNDLQTQAQHYFDNRFPRTPAKEYPDSYSDADSRSSSPGGRPPAKRRQTGPSDELGNNWVMVGKSGSPATTPRVPAQQSQTPRNRNQAPSVATGRRIHAPANRRATASLVPLNTAVPSQGESRPISSASYASPRSPSPTKIPNPTNSALSSVPRNHASRRSRPSGATATPSHRRTNSSASTASARASRSFKEEIVESSPRLSAEARKLAARRKQEDEDTDFRMEFLNKQLQDMIRQGKEALGTTVEVEGDDASDGGGGGWEDYP